MILKSKIGNIASIANMIKHIVGACIVSHNPDTNRKAKSLVNPGVGSFHH